MQRNIVTPVVVLCLVSLVGGALVAMPLSATAATGTWVSPAWMTQGKYGGILRTVDQLEPDHRDLHQAGCNPATGAARDLFNTLVMYNPVKPDEIIADLAQLWATQMRRNLGLDIEVKVVDIPTGVNTFVAGDFDLGIRGYAYDLADPDDWVNAVYGPGARNYTRWKNPQFLKLLDQQSRELDRDIRWRILRKMEEFLSRIRISRARGGLVLLCE